MECSVYATIEALPVKGQVSELTMLRCEKGFYLGRAYHNGELWIPYNRESDYFKTPEDAVNHYKYITISCQVNEDEFCI